MTGKFAFTVLSAILLSAPAGAVTISGTHTGADFLKFGIGTRASAMGEAAAALRYDVTSAYWNPAGISDIASPEFGAVHSDAIEDVSLEFFGCCIPLGDIGVFGANTIFMLYEPIPLTLESEESIGELKWFDWSAALSYGRNVTGDISAGAGVKIIQRVEDDPVFGGTTGTAYACDLGLIYDYPRLEGLSFGAALLNLGTKIQLNDEWRKDDLPRTFRVGAAYSTGYLTFAADFNSILSEEKWYNMGGEYEPSQNLFLRAGYFNKTGNLQGLTYGIGTVFGNFEVGWANVPSGGLIGSERENRVSLIISF